MDWNLLVAILGIIVCSFAAFMVGFCAGSSIGQLREHERVSQAISNVVKNLEVQMDAAIAKKAANEQGFQDGVEAVRVMESRDA